MAVISLCLNLLAKLFYKTTLLLRARPGKEEKITENFFYKSDKYERNYIVHSFIKMKIKTKYKTIRTIIMILNFCLNVVLIIFRVLLFIYLFILNIFVTLNKET